jgi:hypothetical protein
MLVMVAVQGACQSPSVVQPSIVGSSPLAPCPARNPALLLPRHLLIYLQAEGKIKVAAAAGSALAPGAVALLEVEGVEALAASKPEDWQLVQRSATSEVGGECLAVAAADSHFRLCGSLSVVVGDKWLTEWSRAVLYCLMLLYCLQVDPGYLSEPSAVEFKTEGGLTAFMNYYPPKNKVCNTANPFGRFCDCCALLFAIKQMVWHCKQRAPCKHIHARQG